MSRHVRRALLALTAAPVLASCAGRAAPVASPHAAGMAAGAVPAMLGEGVLSTDLNEFGGTLSPDGAEIYYSISVPRSYAYAMVVSRRTGAGWTEPSILSFSGSARDYDPVFSPDGRRMYFVSDRAPDGTLASPPEPDLWMAERDARGGWQPPRRMPAPINTPPEAGRFLEHFASEAADGTLYIAADRPGAPGVDLYAARRRGDGWAEPQPLGAPVETPGLEGEPMIAPDGSFLLFAAYERAGGFGHFDLYISHRTPTGGWGEPVNLGPAVNSEARDYSPRLAPDGHTLIYTSERHFASGPRTRPLTYTELAAGLGGTLNGNGNMYAVDLRALGVLPGGRATR